MEDLNFTLLEENQIFGEERLSIFEKCGTKAAITDFAILLGGYVSDYYYTNEGNDLKDRTGWWWTKTDDGANDARVVDSYGPRDWRHVNERDGGARPALPYSLIHPISSNVVRSTSGIKEVEYGEYPQTIVNESLSNELEKLYNENKLQQTGKNYTTDSVRCQDYNTSFKARTHSEYEYNGSKYIRFVGDSNCDEVLLSDGRRVHSGNVYWVHVEPITWLVDERANIALSKKIIFSGVQFNNKRNYKGDFDSTDMHYFLTNYFSKDIVPSKIKKPKLYIVNFSDEKEKYYPAYEREDILREFYTNIELVPEDANFFKEDALKYYSKKLVSKIEYYPYISKKIEADTAEYLNYLFELSILGENEEIYTLCEEEYNKRKANEEYIERKVDELLNEQVVKLIMK